MGRLADGKISTLASPHNNKTGLIDQLTARIVQATGNPKVLRTHLESGFRLVLVRPSDSFSGPQHSVRDIIGAFVEQNVNVPTAAPFIYLASYCDFQSVPQHVRFDAKQNLAGVFAHGNHAAAPGQEFCAGNAAAAMQNMNLCTYMVESLVDKFADDSQPSSSLSSSLTAQIHHSIFQPFLRDYATYDTSIKLNGGNKGQKTLQ